MKLVVKQDDRLINQAKFIKGPIYLGRHSQCQIFLPNRSVSRQHAVIFLSKDEKWMVKDLDSANKTYVNEKVIDEIQINTGDRIHISNYVIEIDLEKDDTNNRQIPLEDTLAPICTGPKLLVRKIGDLQMPAIRIPAKRVYDLHQILRKVARASGGPETLNVLNTILITQFHANRVWVSFRYDLDEFDEEMGGCTENGQPFNLKDEALSKIIEHARDNREFRLLLNVKKLPLKDKEQSVIIAPIIASKGSLGVLYIESKPDQIPFTMSDLDYAMILSVNLGVIFENY